MGDYQSKPTRYHKINARVRVEARWAISFDAWGVPYTYEKEDVILEGLKYIRYLPDFYIQSLVGEIGVEVKGKKATDIEVEKCNQWAFQKTSHMLLLEGSPFNRDYQGYLFYPEYDLLECKNCGRKLNINDIQCDQCGCLELGYYLPSKVVRQCETEFSQSSADDLYLIHTSGLPITWHYNSNALQAGFYLASHAHFEFYRNIWQPSIWDSVAINPAFSSQDWTEEELLYSCLEGQLPKDWVKCMLDNGQTIWDYIRFYEGFYRPITEGGSIVCISFYERAISLHRTALVEFDKTGMPNEHLSLFDGNVSILERERDSIPIELDFIRAKFYILRLTIGMLSLVDWIIVDAINRGEAIQLT